MSDEIATTLFRKTGVKIAPDDPVLHMLELQKNSIAAIQEEAVSQIAHEIKHMTQEILAFQRQADDEFDAKLVKLQDTLKALDDAKILVVNDIYAKMDERISQLIKERLTSDLRAIAQNANNKVNNQRNLFLGALSGVGVSIVFFILALVLIG